MHKSRLGVLVIDCKTDDTGDAAAFWSAALGYPISDHQPDDRYVALESPEGELRALVQRVDHDSRIHLDVETDDNEAEARRLEALGAKRIAEIKGWIVMEAPSGHRFCLVGPQRSDFKERARSWD